MLADKGFVTGLLSSLVGVVVGGAITSYVAFSTLDRELEQRRLQEASRVKLDIAEIKYRLYKEFLDKYGNITQVANLDKESWWELNELIVAFNVIGDEEVAESTVAFYKNVGEVRNDMGSAKPENREIYYEALKTLISSMRKSLGIKEVSEHWPFESRTGT